MQLLDDIARANLQELRRAIQKGESYTLPWLNLDVVAYCACKEGRASALPKPFCDDPIDRVMMGDVNGKNVLCLAGGGGQQSAVLSLLGANVTVLDLTPEQLESDQVAARHYGYQVATIQGDMRDLSTLPDACFDRVYQPISTLFVPDLRQVYAGVARVLRPGGLYFADYAPPLTYLAQNKGWDGYGYTLYVTEPYVRGAIRETADGTMGFSRGELTGEFHHLLSDILNGLIDNGLSIRAVWENPRPGSAPGLDELDPGSEAHREQYIPFGLSVLAQKLGQESLYSMSR
jgi:ubiquinone/menaquinone biosynthesis C-methylase UbiE